MPVVVGIAGGTASGKSTVAAALVEALGDRCVHLLHDRYYHPLPPGRAPLDWNFDHPDALETSRMVEDVRLLRSGRPARVPRYDFARHARHAEEDELPPRPVIVVEGILVLADPALRAEMDHRVFVHAPDDVRLMRRIRRDRAERGREIDEILAQWERTVRPMHQAYVATSRPHAHLELDGTAPIRASVEQLLALPGLAPVVV